MSGEAPATVAVGAVPSVERPDPFALARRLKTAIWVFDPETCRVIHANDAACAVWRAKDEADLCARDVSAELCPGIVARLSQYQDALLSYDASFREVWTLYPAGVPEIAEQLVGYHSYAAAKPQDRPVVSPPIAGLGAYCRIDPEFGRTAQCHRGCRRCRNARSNRVVGRAGLPAGSGLLDGLCNACGCIGGCARQVFYAALRHALVSRCLTATSWR